MKRTHFVMHLLFSCFALQAAADEKQACIEKCQADQRNTNYDVQVSGMTLFNKCAVMCSVSSKSLKDIPTKVREWHPDNPVVQRCFGESGASDKFMMMTNYETNNCIMEGLKKERTAARQSTAKSPSAAMPTPKPSPTGDSQPSPAETVACDTSRIESLESQCVAEKNAAVGACDETSHFSSTSASTGSSDPSYQQSCQATKDATNLESQLATYRQQCTAAKERCMSSCAQLQSAAEGAGGSCGSDLAASYRSSSGAMLNMCDGLGARLDQIEAQQRALAETNSQAENCIGATAASAAATEGGEALALSPAAPGVAVSGELGAGMSALGDQAEAAPAISPEERPDQPPGVESEGREQTDAVDVGSGLGRSTASTNLPVLPVVSSVSGDGSGPRRPGAVDAPSEKSPPAARRASASDQSKGGGWGRRLRGLFGLTDSPVSDEAARAAENEADHSQSPDLRAFLPKVGGMVAEFDGHGAHADIFKKMHERYTIMESSLIRDPK